MMVLLFWLEKEREKKRIVELRVNTSKSDGLFEQKPPFVSI